MPTSRPVPAGIERFKIARGAVSRLGPVLAKFFAVVVAWMVGFFALLLPMLAKVARAASSSDTHKSLALIGPWSGTAPTRVALEKLAAGPRREVDRVEQHGPGARAGAVLFGSPR